MALASEFNSPDRGLLKYSVNSFLPPFVMIPFVDGDELLVKVGETVSEGQKVINGSEYASHASVPGVVEEIVSISEEDDTRKALKIRLKGAFSYTGKKIAPAEWHSMESGTLCYIFSEKGVLNTFSKVCDLCNQIKNLPEKSAKTLVVRLFDEDPARCTDSFLADNYMEKIIEGSAIIAKAYKARNLVFAYDEKKNEPFENHPASIPASVETFCVGFSVAKYPSGLMHDLVAAIKEKQDASSLKELGCNDLFIDVQTALAAYEAVCFNKPIISRYVHVTGDCLNTAAVMKVKVGASYRSVVEQCGGFKRKFSQIIVDGILTGYTENDLDRPVPKHIKSMEFVKKDQVTKQFTEPCTRCGYCRNICPVKIYPDILYRSYLLKNYNGDAGEQVNSMAILCSDCQLCNSVCPSRLPISQTINLIKESLNEQN